MTDTTWICTQCRAEFATRSEFLSHWHEACGDTEEPDTDDEPQEDEEGEAWPT